jgi:hypothetical protein
VKGKKQLGGINALLKFFKFSEALRYAVHKHKRQQEMTRWFVTKVQPQFQCLVYPTFLSYTCTRLAS